MNWKIETLPIYSNTKAKLQNSLADLNSYCFRFCEIDHIPAMPRTAISDVKNMKNLPSEIRRILDFAQRIEEATPENADKLFYECWTFLHNSFDEKLEQCSKELRMPSTGKIQ